jgi:hypothetical protein
LSAGRENSATDPQAGDYRTEARYVPGRAVLDGAALARADDTSVWRITSSPAHHPNPLADDLSAIRTRVLRLEKAPVFLSMWMSVTGWHCLGQRVGTRTVALLVVVRVVAGVWCRRLLLAGS